MQHEKYQGTTRLPDWLARRASVNAEHVALDTPDGNLTYAELYDVATKLAASLRATGIQPSDHVCVLIRSGLSYATVVHALIQAETVMIPLNWRLTAAEMAWQVTNSGAKVLIYDDALADTAKIVIQKMEYPVHAYCIGEMLRAVESTSERLTRAYIDLLQTQAIMYTSGTTGYPKGALLTYNNHWWNAMGSAIQLGLSPADRWLNPMPLFHVGGLAVLMRSVIYGTTVVIQDGFDAKRVNDAIDNDGITLLSVVPTMLQRMISVRGTKRYPKTLRVVLLGGSAPARTLVEDALALGIPVSQSYGLTEADSTVCSTLVPDVLRKLGSSGRPFLPTEVAILENGKIAVEPNVEGEIIVRGPTVTPGYFRCPDATEQAIRDGWFHTGDVGFLDEEGFLYVLDRRSDLIVSGGENIYPAEVESILMAHPDVQEAGVVGIDHNEWGQVPVAFVKLVHGTSTGERELIDFCADRLAKYKVPRAVHSVDSLPRNASGKLLRKNLRQWLNKQTETV